MLSNPLEHAGFSVHNSARMLEQAIVECVTTDGSVLIDASQLVVHVLLDRSEVVKLGGKPLLQMWPPEITTDVLPDRIVTRVTRKWRRL